MSRPDPRARLEQLRARQARRTEQLRSAKEQLASKKDQLASKKDQLASKKDQLAAKKDQLAAKKDQLASRKDDLRARQEGVRARQEQLRAELEERRKGTVKDPEREPDRRWRWLLLALLALLLLLLARDCRCSEDPVADVVIEPEPPAEPAPVEPQPAPVPEPTDRIDRSDRPEYFNPTPTPVPWLASFRMQVAARSPRLAECFVGANRPGNFKWTTTVDPVEGRVSDHVLEPLLDSDELDRAQRNCVIEVLSDPVYGIDDAQQDTPSRVSLVVEF